MANTAMLAASVGSICLRPRLRLKGSAIRRVLLSADYERKMPALLRALGHQPLPLDCLPSVEPEQGLTREQDGLWGKVLELAERRVAAATTEPLRACRRAELDALRERLVVLHQPWVRTIARQYKSYRLPLTDLVQEASIALLRAIEKFDWRRNVKFRTYAEYWIRQAIERELARSRSLVHVPLYVQQKARRLRRLGQLEKHSLLAAATALGLPATAVNPVLRFGHALVSLDDQSDSGLRLVETLASTDGPTALNLDEHDVLARRVEEAMKRLPLRESDVLRRRFGLFGERMQTLAQIGESLQVSPERVRQIVTRAIERMRHGPGATVLATFLD
jgi:RNA polymerase sigma factor (sigma-70 family)